MKRLLQIVLCFIILSGVAYSGSIEFGYGKSNDWSSAYWTATQIQTQGVNTTGVTSSDGWAMLDFVSATEAQEFDNLTGWTSIGLTIEISPAGQLRELCTGAGFPKQMGTYTYRNIMSAGTASTLFFKQKVDVWSTTTLNTYPSGLFMYHMNVTRMSNYYIKKDANGYMYLCWNSGGSWDNAADYHTTTTPADSRWHILGDYNNNSANNSIFVQDGIEVHSGLATQPDTHNSMIMGIFTNFDAVVPQHHTDWIRHWTSVTPYQTIGTLESVALDAGSGNAFSSIGWNATTSNSTSLGVEARVAATLAGLSSATYFTTTNAGTFSTDNKKQFMQIRNTFYTASGGRYTPVLQQQLATFEASGGGSTWIPKIWIF